MLLQGGGTLKCVTIQGGGTCVILQGGETWIRWCLKKCVMSEHFSEDVNLEYYQTG